MVHVKPGTGRYRGRLLRNDSDVCVIRLVHGAVALAELRRDTAVWVSRGRYFLCYEQHISRRLITAVSAEQTIGAAWCLRRALHADPQHLHEQGPKVGTS